MTSPAWHKYREAVVAFMPTMAGEGLRLRCSVALMRDRATLSLKTAEQEAHWLLQEVERMGMVWWLSGADDQRMKAILDAQTQMYEIARALNAEFKDAA